MIKTSCPHCHASMSAPADVTGKKVRCPKCSAPFTVLGEASPPVVAASPPAPVLRVRARRRVDDDEPPRRRYRCPYCKTDTPPVFRKRMSVVGWIVVVVGTLFTCVGGLLGLLFTEDYRVCPECNGKV